jgi:hypothetical protein
VNGAFPVVRPDGSVVVGFMVIAPFGELNGDWIGASRSVDGGVTFSEATHVSDLQSEPVVGMRAPPLPSLDVDAAGRVYVAWSDCRFHAECSANDIVLATSRDGVTWTSPTRVPTRNPLEEVDHFLPGLAVDPVSAGASARVAVAYYSLRQPNGCSIELCPNMSMNVIESKNGGATWGRPQRLNVESMRVGWLANGGIGGMVGDYISTSYVGGRAVPVFALTSPPLGEVLHEAVFAGVRLG